MNLELEVSENNTGFWLFRLRLALSSPRGPFRNYRRKSTDLKVSWFFLCQITWVTSESNISKLIWINSAPFVDNTPSVIFTDELRAEQERNKMLQEDMEATLQDIQNM